jgi:hypothetical protein
MPALPEMCVMSKDVCLLLDKNVLFPIAFPAASPKYPEYIVSGCVAYSWNIRP